VEPSTEATVVAPAAPSPPPRPVGVAAGAGGGGRRRVGVDLALGLGLGAALCALAFLTTGGTTNGTNLGPNTWVQIVLVLVACMLGIVAVVVCRPARVWGAVSLTLLAALAALSLWSIAWSVQPANSWLDGNLALSYVAAFAIGLTLARIAPERWRAMIGAVLVVSVVVSGYPLLAKVFPATIAPGQTLFGARLSAPFGYWNAVGLMAALGLPAAVWLGARRSGRPILRALSVPAIAALVAALLLSYSRGALLAGAIGLACWFALVPLRLRGALVLALGTACGGAIALWALGTPGITGDGQSLAVRDPAGHAFGLVLIVVLAVALAAGLVAAFAADRTRLSERDRRRIGTALLALLACVPVLVVIALAFSSRGLTGEISYEWRQVTGTSGTNIAPARGASRLLQAGNLHAVYWSEGIKVGEHALLKGVGAGGFGTASPRYSPGDDVAADAHSYVIQTFADLGLIGLALTLGLLIAWAVAAARAVDLRRPRNGEDRAEERAGLVTLLATVVIFGAHSTIDWTWFIPGLAVPALICAGWLAGRGPLAHPVGRAPRPAIALERLAAVTALVSLALVGSWLILQPLRASDADAAALAALSANRPAAALADLRSAATIDPYSTEPLYYESFVYGALGDAAAARAALRAEVALQPNNYRTWLQLGEYDLAANLRQDGIVALSGAQRLFPHSQAIATELARAKALPRTPQGR
jgi:hypothetical protein